MNRILKQLLSGVQGVYIVGGSVRDILLDLAPTDYDLAVLGDPAAFSESISNRISGRVVELGKPGAPLFRVISSGLTIDVTPVRGGSIRSDLLLRDFTINAMAYDPSQDKLIDACGGQKDLSSGLVRMVSNAAFQDDPVRLIRAYRIAAALNFRIDEKTQQAIQEQADLIRSAPGERIRDELVRLLESPSSAGPIGRMEASGLLFSIFPELIGFKKSSRSSGFRAGAPSEAWIRLLRGYRRLEALLKDRVLPAQGQPGFRADSKREAIEAIQPALLKMAFLLHGIGETSIRLQVENDRGIREADSSIRRAEKICRRLRFSNRDRKSVAMVILYHREPFALFQAHRNRTLTHRKVVRFFMGCKSMTPPVLLHSLAESRKGDDPNSMEDFDPFVGVLFDRFFGEFHSELKAPPLLTGDDLIQAFGLPSSPLIGFLLGKIEVARLSHEISTRKGALSLAEKILSEKLDNPPSFQ